MTIRYQFDEEENRIYVDLNGPVTAEDMKEVFIQVYGGGHPPSASSLWNAIGAEFDLEVIDILNLAQFSQSERELEGQPKTALVSDNDKTRLFCEEYITLVKEAPLQVQLFSSEKAALNWLNSPN